jgi:hypothetical protein
MRKISNYNLLLFWLPTTSTKESNYSVIFTKLKQREDAIALIQERQPTFLKLTTRYLTSPVVAVVDVGEELPSDEDTLLKKASTADLATYSMM